MARGHQGLRGNKVSIGAARLSISAPEARRIGRFSQPRPQTPSRTDARTPYVSRTRVATRYSGLVHRCDGFGVAKVIDLVLLIPHY